MYAIRLNRRILPDDAHTEIETFSRVVDDFNTLEVEAGTTGYMGGDAGHGGRTYFRIEDLGSTCLRVRPLGKNGDSGMEIFLFGDAELSTFIRALQFGAKALEDQKNKVYD